MLFSHTVHDRAYLYLLHWMMTMSASLLAKLSASLSVGTLMSRKAVNVFN